MLACAILNLRTKEVSSDTVSKWESVEGIFVMHDGRPLAQAKTGVTGL